MNNDANHAPRPGRLFRGQEISRARRLRLNDRLAWLLLDIEADYDLEGLELRFEGAPVVGRDDRRWPLASFDDAQIVALVLEWVRTVRLERARAAAAARRQERARSVR